MDVSGTSRVAADDIRTRDQPQDREVAWAYVPTIVPPARRRGDRVVDFAAPAHVGCWHIASVRCDASTAVAIGGIADVSRSLAARWNDANDPSRTSAARNCAAQRNWQPNCPFWTL